MNNGIKKVVNMKILQEIYYLMLVVEADMPTYFYPLMDINLTDKPLECLRLGALGVIAHMLKLVHTYLIF